VKSSLSGGAILPGSGTPGRRFLIAVVGILILTAVGAIGFRLIEGFSLVDSLYMSIITISTVGYGEVHPLSPEGRIFTMVLIVTGVGTAFYLLATAAELLIEGQLRDFLGANAMQRRIHQLEGHVIICGYGRFGKAVAEELLRHAVPIVVIDPDPSLAPEFERAGVMHMTASALEDEILEEAGVRNARAIVVATGSDADNVYITLSAREKNPQLGIHARGESEGGMRRLRLAGADQIVSAYQRGGMRIASQILRPAVVDFLELAAPGRGTEVDLEEIRIEANSPLIGQTIEAVERGAPRLRIVALKRGTDPIALIPDSATAIEPGDHLVAIGERSSLKQLAERTTSAG
jgi:voltage-gated potassium channel